MSKNTLGGANANEQKQACWPRTKQRFNFCGALDNFGGLVPAENVRKRTL